MNENMIKSEETKDFEVKKVLLTSLKAFVVFTLLLGVVYPLGITGIAQVTMKKQADGSIIYRDGKVVGSEKIGQKFEGEEYFHSRPSAVNYDASKSGGTNFGPTNEKLKTDLTSRIAKVRAENNIATNVNIPSDMVTSSGSGLDPNISIENANLQAKRVAKKRKLTENEVKEIIVKNTDSDFIGIWGQESVNVLKLNIALDSNTYR